MDTSVAIIGAGPAGLILSHLLKRAGIDCIVLEASDRGHIESRIRAGVLEDPTVRLIEHLGLADRLRAEGLVHEGVNLQFEGDRHRIDFVALTGKGITVYGQQELVKDLVAARMDAEDPLLFEARVLGIEDLEGRPVVHFSRNGKVQEIRCDVVAGCDGFHGVSRTVIPGREIRVIEHQFPFAWLGILAQVPPSTKELIYAYHRRGFAMHSMRSPTLSRLYLQVDPDELLQSWPDDRIWAELQLRLASPEWELREGEVLEKSITAMRSVVSTPMAFGNLFLLGDAAHIVPPTGAKGLNLAVADACVLASALKDWYQTASREGLNGYSDACQSRVWRAQEFSAYMTSLLHVDEDASQYARGLQEARQRAVVSSQAVQSVLAENYVGFSLPSRLST